MSLRITQQRTEVARQATKDRARVTQLVVEDVNQPSDTQNARITNLAIEQVNQPPDTQNARCTQLVLEIITSPRAVIGALWNPWMY